MPQKALLCGMSFALLALAGCGQRLNVEKTLSVAAGGVNELTVTGPTSEQKVSVEISSSASAIDAYVVLEQNREQVKSDLLKSKTPDSGKVLAGKSGVKDHTLEATVPAGKEFAVVIGGATNTTEVKLKVVGR